MTKVIFRLARASLTGLWALLALFTRILPTGLYGKTLHDGCMLTLRVLLRRKIGRGVR